MTPAFGIAAATLTGAALGALIGNRKHRAARGALFGAGVGALAGGAVVLTAIASSSAIGNTGAQVNPQSGLTAAETALATAGAVVPLVVAPKVEKRTA